MNGVRLVVGLLNDLSGNGGKNTGNGFLVSFVAAADFDELVVHPKNFSLVIQNRIGNLEIPKQLPLYHTELGGKADNLIIDFFAVKSVEDEAQEPIEDTDAKRTCTGAQVYEKQTDASDQKKYR